MKAFPIGTNVVVELVKTEKIVSGILVPNSSEKFYHKIIAIGSDVKTVHVGDNVLLNAYEGRPIQVVDIENQFIVPEIAIVAILEV